MSRCRYGIVSTGWPRVLLLGHEGSSFGQCQPHLGFRARAAQLRSPSVFGRNADRIKSAVLWCCLTAKRHPLFRADGRELKSGSGACRALQLHRSSGSTFSAHESVRCIPSSGIHGLRESAHCFVRHRQPNPQLSLLLHGQDRPVEAVHQHAVTCNVHAGSFCAGTDSDATSSLKPVVVRKQPVAVGSLQAKADVSPARLQLLSFELELLKSE